MEAEDLEKLRVYATITNTLDKYVYLREDEKGKYIEYAFIEGAPHDNRCLSWYDSYQENAYIRNGWVKDINNEDDKAYLDFIKRKKDERVNNIFELESFTCGFEEDLELTLKDREKTWNEYHPGEVFIPEEHICRVGCPAKYCRSTHCVNWTYEEPVKCACWVLHECTIPCNVSIPIEIAIKLFDKILELKKL